MSSNITFVVFTYNESRRIEYILRCFHPYGKILIMDNYSTDATPDICRRYGADVQPRVHLADSANFAEHEIVARTVFSRVTTEWIYWGYADEILPHTLLRTLQRVAEEDRYKQVIIPRKNIHYGIRNLNLASNWSPRFFHKGYVDFTNNTIGQMGKFTGKPEEVLRLPRKDAYSLYHCSTYDVRKFELAHSGYSTTESHNAGARFSPVHMLLYPLYFFLRYYLLAGEWKNGWPGFIMTMQYCFFYFNLQAKLWERENGVTLDSIEKNYDAIKEDLLRES